MQNIYYNEVEGVIRNLKISTFPQQIIMIVQKKKRLFIDFQRLSCVTDHYLG